MKYYVPTSSHGGMVQVAKFEDAYLKVSDHEAEVARLRAEIQNAAKAALDAVALACEKEREADALRVNAMRYLWLRDRSGSSPTPSGKQPAAWIEGSGNLFVESDWLTGERADRAIDAAMGASA